MKKSKSGTIAIKKIKHVTNSRIRDNDDVADLMEDIKQRGLLQPVAIRIKDNALIFGNRRVKAYEKLGFKDIECDFYDDVDDNDLLVMNLVENIKRKSIESIEIGRICKMLIDNGMTRNEVAAKLSIPRTRVETVISAYNVAAGTPFESMTIYGKCKAFNMFLHFNEKELNKELIKHKTDNINELMRTIIKGYNPNLLF